MKKSHAYDVLSNKKCIERGCTKKIKLRLVEQKPTVQRCFRHHMAKKRLDQSRRRPERRLAV